MRIALAILLAVLVPGSYYICEYFYADDLNGWWHLRQNLYAAQVTIAFYILQMNESRPKWNIFYFMCAGVCFQNLADNIGNVYGYTWFDAVAVAITGILAYIKYIKLTQQVKNNGS